MMTRTSLVLMLGLASSAQADDPKPLKALLITGGCCHDYSAQKTIIKDGLEARANIEVTVVQQGGTGTFAKIAAYDKDDWAKGYDVVLHDECFADTKDPEWTRKIVTPHKNGVPAVVIHCAMHCYRDGTDQWFEFCGVTSRRHGAAYPHEVLNRDPEHPIMKDFGPAWANPAGELYWIEKVWPTAHPLGVSKNKETGKEEVCVWTNQYGKGRVFGTTIGHHNETVSSDEFLDLLTRGTLWACDKLDKEHLKPPKPAEARVDLAKGKPALASSEETGKNNFARNAVDGNPATRWCASSDHYPQWWQVDLGRDEPITGVRLSWESDGTAYRCKVEGSADGSSWSMLADASKNEKPGAMILDFPVTKARIVRVTCLGSGGGWASLKEVRVLGDKTVAIAPSEVESQADASTLAEVKRPDGYAATLFAKPPAVQYPVAVAAAANGDLYVSVDKNGSLGRGPHRGAVYRLRDLDKDGRADQVNLFVPDVDSPRGLVWDHDRLYLMHPPHLSAFIDHDGDGRADEEKVLVKNIAFGFKDRPADHTSNGVTLGIDGWLYLAIGDFGFMDAEGADGKHLQLRGGGVVRVRPDGSGLEVYSRGTRNILEVAMDPRLNGFARDNTNDGGGWDIRLHHFTGGEHHGYPSLFKNFGDEIIRPLADYGGGSGCGGLYLAEPGFPGGDGDTLYTCDWGNNWVYRHHVTPEGATYKADQSEFLGVPRVTDLDVDGNANLYVSSWKGAVFDYAGEDVGFIARVTPRDARPDPLPDFEAESDLGLVKLLESKSHRRRMEAQRALLRRDLGDARAVEALKMLASDAWKNYDSRIAAVYALALGQGEKAADFLVRLFDDATIREYVLRALSDDPKLIARVPSSVFVTALSATNPRLRRQAAESLARLGKVEHAAALSSLLGDRDPVVSHAAERAMSALNAHGAAFAVLDRAESTPEAQASAYRAIRGMHDARVVDALIARIGQGSDLGNNLPSLAALCRLHSREGVWKGDSWGTRPDTSGPYYQPEAWSETPRIAKAIQETLARSGANQAAYLIREMDRHKITIGHDLDDLIARAGLDASLGPAVARKLAGSPSVPPSAIPLLIRVASDAAKDSSAASSAVVALAKTKDDAAFRAILTALAELKDRDQTIAARAFLSSPDLSHHADLFASEAKSEQGVRSCWADAALLAIGNDGAASPEARQIASKSVEAAWSRPGRRAQVVRAAGMARDRRAAERVLASLSDPDPSVVAAARVTARTLGLDPKKILALREGPRVASMKVEEVLAAIESPSNHASEGDLVFGRLACANCHAVRADEPPRGPYLGTIASTYKRRELAEAVLVPSKTIAQGFATNIFALSDGRTLTGFVVKEAADSVTIRTSEGKEVVISPSDIEERKTSVISVMPEGQVKDLSIAEFGALLDYVQSLATK